MDRPTTSTGEARQSAYEALLDRVRTHGVPGHWAEHALVAVVHALELRVSGGEAEVLDEALPPELHREMRKLHPHRHRGEPQLLSRQAFMEEVAGPVGLQPTGAENVVRAVFRALRPLYSPEKLHAIGSQLPGDLRELWEPPTVH